MLQKGGPTGWALEVLGRSGESFQEVAAPRPRHDGGEVCHEKGHSPDPGPRGWPRRSWGKIAKLPPGLCSTQTRPQGHCQPRAERGPEFPQPVAPSAFPCMCDACPGHTVGALAGTPLLAGHCGPRATLQLDSYLSEQQDGLGSPAPQGDVRWLYECVLTKAQCSGHDAHWPARGPRTETTSDFLQVLSQARAPNSPEP